MTLLDLCSQITSNQAALLPSSHKLNARLVCPEYSGLVPEVKTYPLPRENRIFALCWNIQPDYTLYSTMCPAPEPFCCCHHFRANDRTQLHTHDYLELSYIVEGDFRQKILGKTVTFSKGDLCLIDKNCLHQDYLAKPAVILFLGIANDMFTEVIREDVTTQRITSFLKAALLKQKDLQQYLHFRPSPDAVAEMEDCLLIILKELYHTGTGFQHICKGALLRVFRLLSTKYEFSLSREQKRKMSWIVFEEVSAYMREHYRDITIQDLSDSFHFQKDYFNRLIQSKTGLTYSAYLQQIRLNRARELLLSSDKTIDEIALEVGYQNKGYFYKIFRKQFGMTPYQFRKTL